MRSLLAINALVAALFSATTAEAEKRIFIIANNGGSYGVDRCLASGQACGAAAATAYCRSREFAQAQSFRKVDRDDITGSVPTNGTGGQCRGSACEEFVAIECAR